MVHRLHVASGFEFDGVTCLNLHKGDIVGRGAHLIGADRPNGVDSPSVFGEFKNFLPEFRNLESTVCLD